MKEWRSLLLLKNGATIREGEEDDGGSFLEDGGNLILKMRELLRFLENDAGSV